jgi:hypothetical protein
MSAGARLTVKRFIGNEKLEFRTAGRTRSFDSWTAAYVGDFNFLLVALILRTETPFSRLSMTSIILSSDHNSLPSVENMAYFPMNPYSVDLHERIVDSVAVGRSRADVNPPFPNLADDAHRRSLSASANWGRQLHIASN